MQLLALLQLIPGTFWSAVVASLLTLGGVYASNRGSTKRLRVQLDHDSTEKARERTASLRKEVYLKAAEELAKVGVYLVGLAQIDLSKVNPASGLQDFLAAAARLQLVAEPKTAMLANSLAAAYGEVMLRLLPKLVPLGIARSSIATHDDLYNQANAETKRVLAEMARFNEAATVNDQVFAAMQRSFAGFQQQANIQATHRADSWNLVNALTLEFARTLVSEQRVLLRMQIPLLVAIRSDLGLTTDLAAYEQQLSDQWERMATQIDTSLAELKSANPSIERTR